MTCKVAKVRRVEVTSLSEVRPSLARRRYWPTCEGKPVKYCRRAQTIEDGEVTTIYLLGCPVHDATLEYMERI